MSETKKPLIMGILNVTPDSFFDGGRYADLPAVLARAEQILQEGADILDIGGESTRPGAAKVQSEEEIKRVIPAIKEIKKHYPNAVISVDTYHYETALAALREGAQIINDISGLKDLRLADLAAQYGAKLVIMHIKGMPDTMQNFCDYKDIFKEISSFFEQKIALAQEHGVNKENIILDIGLGFAKTREQNWLLLENISRFKDLGFPLLIGASRKSFTDKSLEISLKCAQMAARQGASYLRVHDVKETVSALEEVYAK